VDFLNNTYLILGIISSAIAIIIAIIGVVKLWKNFYIRSKQQNKSPIILPNLIRKQDKLSIKSRWVIPVVIIVFGGIAVLLIIYDFNLPFSPQLASSYSGIYEDGSVLDGPAYSLVFSSIVEDRQGNISGKALMNGQHGVFTGNITHNKTIFIYVTLIGDSQLNKFSFSGSVKSTNHLEGDWSTDRYSTPYGTWDVSPVQS